MVEKYIRQLLFDHDCVVIPEFGGFIAHYVSATIHPIRHTFAPPSKAIAFNEMLKLNDGLLISRVASGEYINLEDAAQEVKKFVEKVTLTLQSDHEYYFEDIGTLSLNYEQKLQFEPENKVNYLNESFGLPELMHKPVDRNAAYAWSKTKDRTAVPLSEQATAKEDSGDELEPVFRAIPRKKRNSPMVSVALLGVLLISFGIGYFLLGNGNTALSSIIPVGQKEQAEDTLTTEDLDFRIRDTTVDKVDKIAAAEPKQKETASTDDGWNTAPATEESTKQVAFEEEPVKSGIVAKRAIAEEKKPAPVEPAVVKAEKKETPEATIEAPQREVMTEVLTQANATPRYYVIVGGFSVKKNAFKLKKELAKKGHPEAKVILPNNTGTLFKVSSDDFDDKNMAISRAEALKADYGSSVWVFKF